MEKKKLLRCSTLLYGRRGLLQQRGFSPTWVPKTRELLGGELPCDLIVSSCFLDFPFSNMFFPKPTSLQYFWKECTPNSLSRKSGKVREREREGGGKGEGEREGVLLFILPHPHQGNGRGAASLFCEVMHILFFNRVNVPLSSMDMPLGSQGGQVLSVSHFLYSAFPQRGCYGHLKGIKKYKT